MHLDRMVNERISYHRQQYCKLHGDFILQPTYGECSEDGYKEMKLGWPHSKQTETPTQMKTNE